MELKAVQYKIKKMKGILNESKVGVLEKYFLVCVCVCAGECVQSERATK